MSSVEISQDWFVFFDETLPYVALLIPLASFMVLGLLAAMSGVLLLCCAKLPRNERTQKTTELLRTCLKTMERLVHHSVRAIFGMRPLPGDTDESPRTGFFGYAIPTIFLVQVFCMVVLLSGYAVSAFLDAFFVKGSNECDANNPVLNCFTVNASNMTGRVDCSAIDSTFNGTLRCYEFIFDASEALSDAGGILGIGGVAFATIATLILRISKGKDGCKSKRRCCCTVCTQSLMCCGMVVLFDVLPAFFVLSNASGVSTTIELLVLFTIVCNTICIPWCLFQKAPTARAVDESIEMNIPPQSYPIKLPVGPPDIDHK